VGVAALGQCWATVADAAAAVCGTNYPSTDGVTVVSCQSSANNTLTLVKVAQSGNQTNPPTTTYVGPLAFPQCEVSTWPTAPLWVSPVDAGLVGAAVVMVWGAAFAWRAIRATVSDRDLG
jgi:hypothetical protein